MVTFCQREVEHMETRHKTFLEIHGTEEVAEMWAFRKEEREDWVESLDRRKKEKLSDGYTGNYILRASIETFKGRPKDVCQIFPFFKMKKKEKRRKEMSIFANTASLLLQF